MTNWEYSFNWTSPSSPPTVGGLSCGTQYDFAVKADCGSSMSNLSLTLTCSTGVCTCNTPSQFTCGTITQTSISMIWNAVTGASSGYEIQYRPAGGSYTWNGYVTGSTNYTFLGLTSNTQYEFQVRSNCGSSYSNWSVSTYCTTSGSGSCSVPTGLACTNSTQTSITLTWNTVSGAIGYYVYYKNHTATNWEYSFGWTNPASPPVVAGLSCGMQYDFAVKANCGSSMSNLCSTVTCTTGACTCNQPTGLTCGTITQTSVTMIWNAVTGASLGYELQYRPTGGSYSWNGLATGNTSYTITNLTGNTQYEFQVRSNCGSIYSTWTGSVFCTTSTPGACNSPTNLACTNSTQSSITLTWNTVSGATGYYVYYKNYNSTNWEYSFGWTNPASPPVVTGLSCGTQYDFAVKADCGSSMSNLSPTTTCTTEACTCNTPTGLTCGTITQSSVSMSWNGVTGASSGYEIQYRPAAGNNSWNGYVTGNPNYTVQSLTSNTQYEFQVRSNCGSGYSYWSVSTYCTTSASGTCSIPTGLACINPTQSSITLTWNIVSGATSYYVYYKNHTATNWEYSFGWTNPTSPPVVTGLSCGTQYDFAVKANCGSSMSDLSSTVSCYSGICTCTQPTGLTCGTITQSSVTMTWNAVTGASSGYEIQYRPAGGSNSWNVFTTGNTSFTITNLTGNTQFEFQVRSNCGSSFSTWTGSTLCTTSTPSACDPPTGLICMNSNQSSITLTWNAVTGAAGYYVYYKNHSATNWEYSFGWDNPGSPPTVTQLSCGTQYDFAVKTDCGSLMSNVSSTVTFSTTGCNCNSPTALTCGISTQTSITMFWTSVTSGSTGYELRYKPIGSGSWNVFSTIYSTYACNGLNPNSEYEFQVRSNCGGTFSAWSLSSICPTANGCSPPNEITYVSSTSNSITISWTPVPIQSTGYQVQYRLIGTSIWIPVNTNNTTVTIQNLNPSSQYELKVRTFCSSIQSIWSYIVSCSTQQPGPGYILVELSPNPNPGQTSEVEENGSVYRYYQLINIATSDPTNNIHVKFINTTNLSIVIDTVSKDYLLSSSPIPGIICLRIPSILVGSSSSEVMFAEHSINNVLVNTGAITFNVKVVPRQYFKTISPKTNLNLSFGLSDGGGVALNVGVESTCSVTLKQDGLNSQDPDSIMLETSSLAKGGIEFSVGIGGKLSIGKSAGIGYFGESQGGVYLLLNGKENNAFKYNSLNNSEEKRAKFDKINGPLLISSNCPALIPLVVYFRLYNFLNYLQSIEAGPGIKGIGSVEGIIGGVYRPVKRTAGIGFGPNFSASVEAGALLNIGYNNKRHKPFAKEYLFENVGVSAGLSLLGWQYSGPGRPNSSLNTIKQKSDLSVSTQIMDIMASASLMFTDDNFTMERGYKIDENSKIKHTYSYYNPSLLNYAASSTIDYFKRMIDEDKPINGNIQLTSNHLNDAVNELFYQIENDPNPLYHKFFYTRDSSYIINDFDYTLSLDWSGGLKIKIKDLGYSGTEEKSTTVEKGVYIDGTQYLLEKNNTIPLISTSWQDVFTKILFDGLSTLNPNQLLTINGINFTQGGKTLADTVVFNISNNGSKLIFPPSSQPGIDSLTCYSWTWYGNQPTPIPLELIKTVQDDYINYSKLQTGFGGFYSFTPNITPLVNPAILSLNYPDSEVLVIPKNTLGIYYQDTLRCQWHYAGGIIDSINDIVTANIDTVHLYYTIARIGPEGNIGLNSDKDTLYLLLDTIANITTDTLKLANGLKVGGNYYYTVISPYLRILTPDADTVKQGIQLKSNTSVISFQVSSSGKTGLFPITLASDYGNSVGQLMIKVKDTITPLPPFIYDSLISDANIGLILQNIDFSRTNHLKVYFDIDSTGLWSGHNFDSTLISPLFISADDTIFIDGIQNNSKYFFRIKAVNPSGIESPYSNIFSCVPRDTIAPGKVKKLFIQTIDSITQISFFGSGDNGYEGLPSCYKIKYSNQTPSDTVLWWQIASEYNPPPTPQDPTLLNEFHLCDIDSSYYLGIQAIDDVGLKSPITISKVKDNARTALISLSQGRNLISFGEVVSDTNLLAILGMLIEHDKLNITIDQDQHYIRLSQDSGWVNDIGNNSKYKGYCINVKDTCNIVSFIVNETELSYPLTTGWNLISYPFKSSSSASSVVQDLISAGVFEKLVDEHGNTLEFISGYGLSDNICHFTPNEGYWIKLNNDANLVIQNPSFAGLNHCDSNILVNPQSTHFAKCWSGNPFMPMNIIISNVMVNGNTLEPGDEIGVFNGNLCVGSLKISNSQPFSFLQIITSRDDPWSNMVDGFTNGNPITFKIWKSQSHQELTPTSVQFLNGSSGDFIDLETKYADIFSDRHSVSGYITYNNNQNTPLANVTISLLQNSIIMYSSNSDSTGFYVFNSIPNGQYSVSIDANNKQTGGFNNTDAVKIRRHFANIETITSPIRILAADVNATGSVNNSDAVKIRMRFANLDTHFVRGDWVFMKPEGGNEIFVNGANIIQNFWGLCVGDVNGTYIPH